MNIKFKDNDIKNTSGIYSIIGINSNLNILSTAVSGNILNNGSDFICNSFQNFNSDKIYYTGLNNAVLLNKEANLTNLTSISNSFINFPGTPLKENQLNENAPGGAYILNNNTNFINKNFYTWTSKIISKNTELVWTNYTSYAKITKSGEILSSDFANIQYLQAVNKELTISLDINKDTNINFKNSYLKSVNLTLKNNIENISKRYNTDLTLNCFNKLTLDNIILDPTTKINLQNINLITLENDANILSGNNTTIINTNLQFTKNFQHTIFNADKIIETIPNLSCSYINNLYFMKLSDYAIQDFSLYTIKDSDYNSSVSIYENSSAFVQGFKYFGENGNQIFTKAALDIKNTNNSIKYSLAAHSHNNIFPYQNANNYSYNKSTNENITDKINDNEITYCSGYTIGNKLIPEQTVLPIGSIIGWIQYKFNNEWVPSVPNGFYALSENISTAPLITDPNDPYYNEMYGLLNNYIYDVVHKDNNNMYHYFISIPTAQIIEFNSDNARLIKILKVNESWSYNSTNNNPGLIKFPNNLYFKNNK